MATSTKQDSISAFFAKYPPRVRELATAARLCVRSAIPDAVETLDESGRVVGYAIGAGYSGLVCTIIPSKTGLKLGVVRGAELPDPNGLMEGAGKRHRYLQISTTSDVERPGIAELLQAARRAAIRKPTA